MKKIILGAIAGIALLTTTAATAGGYDNGYRHGHRGHHGNNASFYIGFGPHGHMSYGMNVGHPRVYIQQHRAWRPNHQQYRYNQRPHRMHQRIVHRSRGYCPQHNGWHR